MGKTVMMLDDHEQMTRNAYALFITCWNGSPYVDGEFQKVWERARRALDALQYEYSVPDADPLPFLAYRAVEGVRDVATGIAASCSTGSHRVALRNLMVVYAEVWALWQNSQALHPEASPFSKS